MSIWCHDNFIRHIIKAQFANWVIKGLARRKPKWINDQNIWGECGRHRNNQNEALGSKKKIKAQQVNEGEQERSETTSNRSKWSNLAKLCRSALIRSFQKPFLLNILTVSCIYKHAETAAFLAQPTTLTHTCCFVSHFFQESVFFLHSIFGLVCPLQKTVHFLHLLCPLFPGGRQQ